MATARPTPSSDERQATTPSDSRPVDGSGFKPRSPLQPMPSKETVPNNLRITMWLKLEDLRGRVAIHVGLTDSVQEVFDKAQQSLARRIQGSAIQAFIITSINGKEEEDPMYIGAHDVTTWKELLETVTIAATGVRVEMKADVEVHQKA
ncbi:hypothetical protein BAUCODRAFT_151351 [Baudoinia panamericana UAMH 10762]|uniref:Uncharacterized protein n=1 Tax=Baudoinia panamericana (strain UAMH 10762) TaxID=717646 RepID=M2N2T4_BAUPA|nr:uncharacterized protein BAUCODRAFT_151351 [Baudoinia panamericana UAMH 10762]EMC92970.1 hypothetical protein BAUCODRAFT_151351 [Baudoinia panamericana UAMH 10762]